MIKQKTRITIKKADGTGLTPTTIFRRLNGHHKFLLETSARYLSNGRYSMIGANPRKTYRGSDLALHEVVYDKETTYKYEGDLVALLKQVMPRISNETSYPFTGGAIGYIRFDRHSSTIPAVNFHIYDTVLIFDHLTEELIGIHTNIDPERPESQLDTVLEQVLAGSDATIQNYTVEDFKENMNEKELDHLQQALAATNVEKVVISQKLSAKFEGDPFAYYLDFRKNAPSAYQYYIEFDDHIVFGSSHDQIVSISNNGNEDATEENETSSTRNFHAMDMLKKVLPSPSFVGEPVEDAYQFYQDNVSDKRLLYGGAIGYIGFNGQIDFAHANNAIIIQQTQATKEIGIPLINERLANEKQQGKDC